MQRTVKGRSTHDILRGQSPPRTPATDCSCDSPCRPRCCSVFLGPEFKLSSPSTFSKRQTCQGFQGCPAALWVGRARPSEQPLAWCHCGPGSLFGVNKEQGAGTRLRGGYTPSSCPLVLSWVPAPPPASPADGRTHPVAPSKALLQGSGWVTAARGRLASLRELFSLHVHTCGQQHFLQGLLPET